MVEVMLKAGVKEVKSTEIVLSDGQTVPYGLRYVHSATVAQKRAKSSGAPVVGSPSGPGPGSAASSLGPSPLQRPSPLHRPSWATGFDPSDSDSEDGDSPSGSSREPIDIS